MTRPILERLISQFGITDASILLHGQPLTLERWRNGQDAMLQDVADWMAGWAADWRSGYTLQRMDRIEEMAKSWGVELDERTAAEPWKVAEPLAR